MKKHLFLSAIGFVLAFQVSAQCDTTDITGDMVINSSTYLSGVYRVSGKFQVNSGKTVFVQAFETNGCGKLEVIADEIVIDGTINGDFSGFEGGVGGAPGQNATSLTGDAVAINTCNNEDNTGIVQLEGGKKGAIGQGPGAGLLGADGGIGSGPKQQCLNIDDESGMIGGSGGAGGGAGAAYGGAGGAGGNGGAGASNYTATGLDVSSAYPVVGGQFGTGGLGGSAYGTLSGNDIQLGSGGSGAGGAGRSFDIGLGGGNGGSGGGLIILHAETNLSITGTVSANGEDGQAGAQGGNGGESPKCCSDGCDDCGEATLSTGAGGSGGAGGGSGGGIFLFSDGEAVITGIVSSNGGNGGQGGVHGNGTSCDYSATFCGSQTLTSGNGNNGEFGGGGGGGRIKIFVPICSTATVTPTTSISGGTGGGQGANGTYFLGCSELSLTESTLGFKLDLFPNPASNEVHLMLDQTINNVQVTILDLFGRTVYSSSVNLSPTATSISLLNMAQGTYQLIAVGNGLSVTKKLIKY